MRDVLLDVLKQSAPFPVLKVIGTTTSTTVLSSSDCKSLIFKGTLKEPIPDFEGEFGITKLSLLTGLLNFGAYKTDASTFSVKRRKIGEKEIVEQFDFSAGPKSKTTATFRLTAPDLIPDITTMTANPTWDIAFAPEKAKIAEFKQLASLYSDVSKTFIPMVDGADLVFMLGNQNSSTHSASLVIEENVSGAITGNLNYSISLFLEAMKLACGNTTLSFKSRTGPLKISTETDYATYDYIIRATR